MCHVCERAKNRYGNHCLWLCCDGVLCTFGRMYSCKQKNQRVVDVLETIRGLFLLREIRKLSYGETVNSTLVERWVKALKADSLKFYTRGENDERRRLFTKTSFKI